jgi:hypothetical protein
MLFSAQLFSNLPLWANILAWSSKLPVSPMNLKKWLAFSDTYPVLLAILSHIGIKIKDLILPLLDAYVVGFPPLLIHSIFGRTP